jgi:hypothetical protein
MLNIKLSPLSKKPAVNAGSDHEYKFSPKMQVLLKSIQLFRGEILYYLVPEKQFRIFNAHHSPARN